MNETEQPHAADSDLVALRAHNEALQAQLLEARQVADARLIRTELKAEALRAGMIDLDGLKLIDAEAVSVDMEGNVVGASDVMVRLRRAKPWLFQVSSSSSLAQPPSSLPAKAKLATEMTLDEWRTARADLLRRR